MGEEIKQVSLKASLWVLKQDDHISFLERFLMIKTFEHVHRFKIDNDEVQRIGDLCKENDITFDEVVKEMKELDRDEQFKVYKQIMILLNLLKNRDDIYEEREGANDLKAAINITSEDYQNYLLKR